MIGSFSGRGQEVEVLEVGPLRLLLGVVLLLRPFDGLDNLLDDDLGGGAVGVVELGGDFWGGWKFDGLFGLLGSLGAEVVPPSAFAGIVTMRRAVLDLALGGDVFWSRLAAPLHPVTPANIVKFAGTASVSFDLAGDLGAGGAGAEDMAVVETFSGDTKTPGAVTLVASPQPRERVLGRWR